MSHLPNPFRFSPNMSPSPRPVGQTPSPGFLMMTRPSNSCYMGQDGRGRSMGRANYKSNYHPQSRGPYSNNSNYIGFGNQNRHFGNRGSPNETSPKHSFNNTNQQMYRSPGNNYFHKQNSFSGSPQGTPNNFRGNFRNNRNFGRNNFNKSASFHQTPLKEVPVDKFISSNMVKDPWEELNYNINFDTTHKSNLNRTSDLFLSNTSGVCGDSESSFNLDGGNESFCSSSTNNSKAWELPSSSPIGATTGTSSEKDTGTESDATSDS